VLGQHKLLFLAWLPFSGYLLYAGKLSRKELVAEERAKAEAAMQQTGTTG